MFNLTVQVLFDQDDLLQGAPEGAYRVTHSIIALIMHVEERALATERAVGKVLHGKAHTVGLTHPNSPYGTRSKAASLSTPNLSTLQHSVLPGAALPLQWEEAGLLRGRRGICLRLVRLGRLQR